MKKSDADLHDIRTNIEYTKTSRRYVAEIRHTGLKTFRVIKDLNEHILYLKVDSQFEIWDDKWARIENKSRKENEKNASLALAEEKTNDAQNALQDIDDLLLNALEIDNSVDWESLKDNSSFKGLNLRYKIEEDIKDLERSFSLLNKPTEPQKKYYEPDFNIFDSIFKSLKQKKIIKAEENWLKRMDEFESDLLEYQNQKLDFENKKDELSRESIQQEFRWQQEKIEYYQNQEDDNKKVDEFRSLYQKLDPDAVQEYCELVLNNSTYPDSFPKNFDLNYNPETKILLVEYTLPSPDCLPNLIEVKYIATKKELKEVYLSEVQFNKMYDSAIYKIVLRTAHELFEADQSNSLDAIILNGWVNAINKATGKMVNNCIISIVVNKSEFLEIDLSNIDPKTCFKNLKGIGSSKLSGITAIQPIAQISKNDKRFIQSQEVIDKLNEGSNIAAMEWQEFEHLIREIFEKEFQSNGGEVKVTQASRDGGVDAVAFDPDPIRGGKIVIQAKRYTNTVGVAAVRDLYGTVVNEGATKGILVTTSDYGPDAYEFARNKPLTLMNGANLLFLLHKHGHKARIDIVEARQLGIVNEP